MGEFTYLEPQDGPAPDASLASLLCALSFASGLALGDRMEHGIGTAYIGLRLADAVRLADHEREAVYYGALLKDAGCTACASLFGALFPDDPQPRLSEMVVLDRTRLGEVLGWLSTGIATDTSLPTRAAKMLALLAQCGPALKQAVTTHCEVAELFAQRLGFGEHVQSAVKFQHERWDGKGLAFGLKTNQAPVVARILSLAQVAELSYGFGGKTLARTRVGEARGTRFDPGLADAFLALAEKQDFWRELEQDSMQATIVEMRPTTSANLSNAAQLDAVCEALAEFADIRSGRRWGHSTAVANHATAIARWLGCTPVVTQRARRAGLVHDLGIVAVPRWILEKTEPLSDGEREQLRLHPYYTERVLERVHPLQHLALEASSHHEWVNGQGYHRRLQGEQIPLLGRVLAVADYYATLEAAGTPDPLATLRGAVGTQLDGACCEALEASLRGVPLDPRPAVRQVLLDRLTDREVEVFQLLARAKQSADRRQPGHQQKDRRTPSRAHLR